MRSFTRGALIWAVLGLAGCGGAPARSPVSDGDGPRSLLNAALAAAGVDLDACFATPPTFAGPGEPQSAPGPAPRPAAVNRLVVAVDSSGSMAARIGGASKLEAAKRAVGAFLGSVPAGTQIGLVVFGHRGSNAARGKAESCSAVETLYPVGEADAGRIEAAMQGFEATGWTPLATAISRAGGAFTPGDSPGAQVVYVVSDGLETCGGDPVAAARTLNSGATRAIVNVIGFDLAAADRAQLQAVADAGGGAFVETTPSRIGVMLDELGRKAGAVSAITRERLDAGARITENNLAAGKYATRVNLCLFHGTTDEAKRVSQALDGRTRDPTLKEAAVGLLQARHEQFRERARRVAADLDARRAAANASVEAQTRSSERRLGQTL